MINEAPFQLVIDRFLITYYLSLALFMRRGHQQYHA